MTDSLAHILAEIDHLSLTERAELADCLVETLARDIPPDIEQAQLEEVRRRVREIESGEVELIPGDRALAEVRRMVETHRAD